MTILQRVNAYKKLLQEYMNAHPNADSDEVLEYLLREHYPYAVPSFVSEYLTPRLIGPLSLFTTTKSAPLVKALRDTLQDKEAYAQQTTSVVDIINSYLEKNPIDKNDDLFALLEAYFYYFEDLYTHKYLKERQAFYQQIFEPLRIHMQKVENDRIESVLLQLDQSDEVAQYVAFQTLGRMAIPKSQKQRVIAKLFEKTDHPSPMVQVWACATLVEIVLPEENEKVAALLLQKIQSADENVYMYACSALQRRVPVSKEQHEPLEKIVSVLLAQIDDPDPAVSNQAYKKLGNIFIPDSQEEAVIRRVLQKIDGFLLRDDFDAFDANALFSRYGKDERVFLKFFEKENDPHLDREVRGMVWNMLQRMTVPPSQFEKAVTKIFELLDNNNEDILIRRDACSMLRKMAFTDVRQQERVIDRLLREADSPYPFMRVAACQAFGEMLIPEGRLERVVAKVIEMASNGDRVHERASACRELGNISIPETQSEAVVTQLLISWNDRESFGVRDAVRQALAKIKIPETQYPQVEVKLNEIINEKRNDLNSIYAYITLAKMATTEDKRIEIFHNFFELVMRVDLKNVDMSLVKLQDHLMKIIEKLSSEGLVRVIAKLEALQEQVATHNPSKLPFLLGFIQACQSKLVMRSAMRESLPPEMAQDVENILSGRMMGPR